MDNPLLNLLRDRQQAVQLRSAEYYRAYRVQTTKRLAKARRDVGAQHKTSKNKTGKDEVVSVLQVNEDIRYGNICLYLAERAWSHAMETKAVLETNSSAGKRKRVISKLAKASKHATNLDYIVEESNDIEPLVKLQVHAYRFLIDGDLTFERHSWLKTVKAYSQARVALQALASAGQTKGSRSLENESGFSTLDSSDLIKDVISSSIDQALSFALYQLDKSRSEDILTFSKKLVIEQSDSKFVELIRSQSPEALEIDALTEGGETKLLKEITWRKHAAKISDPDVSKALSIAVELDSRLGEKLEDSSVSSVQDKLGLFDEVLQGWQDVINQVKENIETLESLGLVSHDKRSQDQYILSTFINYNLLFRRISRDRLIIAQIGASIEGGSKLSKLLEKNRDIVRVYDGILQTVEELASLPGVHNDSDLSSSLESVQGFFKVLRTRVIAESYALSDHHDQSLALFVLASSYVSDNKSIINVDFPGQVVSQNELTELVQLLDSEILRQKGIVSLSSTVQSLDEPPSVVNSLDQYPLGTPQQVLSRLVESNPSLRPVPIKPVYFDIAYNFIGLEEHPTQKVNPPASAKTQDKNQKGFLGSLWRK